MMIAPHFWQDSWTLIAPTARAQNLTHGAAVIVNHLWQSTIIAGVAGLLAFALRKNSARTRYWVWMAASLKFLVPFSLLVTAGEWLRSALAAPVQPPALASVVEQIAQPFPQTPSLGFDAMATPSASVAYAPQILLALWACGSIALAVSWLLKWRRIRAAMRTASPCAFQVAVPALSTPSLLEPGVFGILRPVLMLPEGIQHRLTAPQWEAIVAHEMCHVRRRDNLTFALHMCVETLFWFHPAVWWIRTRLVEERELACDEAVLEAGNHAETYAEGILNVCKFYVESPLACASGVSGSDLKKRIVRIVSEHASRPLNIARKLLLAAAGLIAVALPLFLGLAHTAQLLAQSHIEDMSANLPKFEVSTIKPDKSADNRRGIRFNPDGVSMTGVSASFLLRAAFGIEEDRVLGLPAWAKSNQYDVDAKVDAADAPKLENLTFAQRNGMFLPLLVERFNLKYHHETRELPVYELVIAKGGPKLTESKPGEAPAAGGQHRMMMMRMGGGSIEAKGASISNLIQSLAGMVGRTIVDKTGLTGSYDYTLHWTPDMSAPGGGPGAGPGGAAPGSDGPQPDENAPSLFTAIQEELGLKLEPQKGPVDVIVVDHIDQPSAN